MSHAPVPDKVQPLRARKSGSLKGIATVPGDKSISQRALILGGMALGETRISGLLESEDVLNTANAVQALGATVTRDGEGAWRVAGVGVGNWRQPDKALDFGNSGTGSRLMMGAVATTPITAVFTGDASLRSRPMARVLDPLTRFGTRYEAQGGKALMPVTVIGASDAAAISYDVTVASAQVKSALLLAAINARGTSRIRQNVLTRDHTEKMLAGFGAQITVTALPDGGEEITVWGRLTSNDPVTLTGCAVEVPRDPSSAAFPLVAALIVPGSEISIPAILLNPRRIGLIETLLEMGADIQIQNRRNSGGEEIGDLLVRHSALKGVIVPVERAPSMIDEYPILAVAAAFAEGDTVMQGLEELRVKESDRLSAIARGLEANGIAFRENADSLTVRGSREVAGGGTVATHMDHRIAMAFLTLGMAARNPVAVDDVAMIATSFPSYQTLMRSLGADLAVPDHA
ncbi:MAG: 3-phosphoshikimate 1-carboxyvinyltransferase [Rhizomicrobium sp.]